jgi:hypothetical protein
MSLSSNPTPLSPQDVQDKLDRGDTHHIPVQLGGQVVRRSKRVFKGVWDFAVQGGAIGSVSLYDPMLSPPSGVPPIAGGPSVPLVLPPNFIIQKVVIDTLTALASGGAATVSLGSNVGGSLVDLKAATGFASFTGVIDGIQTGLSANAVKVPAATALPGLQPQLTIAAAALTAGKINIHLEGYLSD